MDVARNWCRGAVLMGMVGGAMACGYVEDDPAQVAWSRWVVDAVPDVRVGWNENRQEYQLDRVMDATRLEDGTLVVVNYGSSELRMFDPEGDFLHSLGGAGDGPGEFRTLVQVQRISGDSLVAFSVRPGLSWFTSHGEYVQTVTWNVMASLTPRCRVSEGNWWLLSDLTFIGVFAYSYGDPGCMPRPQSPYRGSTMIVRTGPYMDHTDTIAVIPGEERDGNTYRPYGASVAVAIGMDRLYLADTADDRITMLTFDGDTIGAVPMPFQAAEVPNEARRDIARSLVDVDGTVRMGTRYDYPDYYPRMGRMVADGEGYVWVMEYPELTRPTYSQMLRRTYGHVVAEEGAYWRVVDHAGRVVADVRTPPRFFLIEIGRDYLLGVERDDLDVEAVALYRLVRSGAD